MVLKNKKYGRIKVYCRVKPTSPEQIPIEYTLSKRFKDGKIRMNLKNKNIKPENSKYKFHDVFPSTSSQSLVFEKVAAPMIDVFVQKGENCTIFSYGQTGSGKTYTMCGSKQVKDRGIIHQTIDQLFDLTQASRSGAEYEIYVSCVEIHNGKTRNLSTHIEPKNKIDSHRVLVTQKSDAIKLFEEMKLKRTTSATTQNQHSSRSHFICTINLRKKKYPGFDAQFKLVDLAGSEEENPVDCDESNKIEALAIKKSLYHLKNITRNLANPRFKGIISYRDSKLTYELRSTLEGKCHIAMIANVDSNDLFTKELINTLEYAREIGSIKKCSEKTLKCHPSFEMRDTQLLKTENKNLKIQMSSLKTKYENATQKISSLKTKNENDTKKYLQEISFLKEQETNLLGRENCKIQDTSKYIGSGDTLNKRECSSGQRKNQIRSVESTQQIKDCTKPDMMPNCNIMPRSAVNEAFKINSASTLLADSSVTHIDSKNIATKLNEEEVKMCSIKIYRDNAILGDVTGGNDGVGEQPPSTVMLFEDVEQPEDAREWWPYARDCYHQTLCGLQSGEAAACGYCEHGHTPAREPAATGRTGAPRFFHYVVCWKRIAGQRCVGHTGVKRVRFVGTEKATAAVETAGDVRPAPVTAAGARGPSDARRWLPYGRDRYHAVRCTRPASGGRADAAGCAPCDFGVFREPADRDGDDGRPAYVHYVWCPRKVGRPADEGLAVTVGAAEPKAVAANSAAGRPRSQAVNFGNPAKTPGPPAKKSGPRAIPPPPWRSGLATGRPSVAAVRVAEPKAAAPGPADRRLRRPQAKNNGPRAMSVAPRPGVARRTLPIVYDTDSVEYYENLIKSMQVPNTYTLLKY